jgi:hypothetical protein
MVVFLPQLTMINIEIPAHFPSGSARTRTRGGAWRMRDAIGKITGGVHNLAEGWGSPALIQVNTGTVIRD